MLRSLSGETEPYSLLLLVSSTTTGTGREILRRYSEGQEHQKPSFLALIVSCIVSARGGRAFSAQVGKQKLLFNKKKRSQSFQEGEMSKCANGKLASFSEKKKERNQIVLYHHAAAPSDVSGSKLQPLCINYETAIIKTFKHLERSHVVQCLF